MPPTLADDRPFSLAARQMSKFLDQLNKGYYGFCGNSETWTPPVNLYETDSAYHVCVDLSGVEKEKIDIVVQATTLILRGTRAVPMTEATTEAHMRRVRVHLMEIDHGSFSRKVELPHDVSNDRISAQYRDGMLWIDLPKK